MPNKWSIIVVDSANRYWIHHAKQWCEERFGESTESGPWIMHVTPAKMVYDSARVVIFFKNREDMMWFKLTWG